MPQLFPYANQICSMANAILIKDFYVSLNEVIESVVAKQQPLHVILLFRDPRAVYASRHDTFGGKANQQIEIWRICGNMRENLNELERAQMNYNNNLEFILARYEDLAGSPEEFAKSLYGQLSLSFDENVERWLAEHTRLTEETKSKINFNKSTNIYKYSTWREDSSAQISAWYVQLSVEIRKEIESQCFDVMQLLGYKPVEEVEFNQKRVRNYHDFINDDYPMKRFSINSNR
jgi:Sulfotransferase domain